MKEIHFEVTLNCPFRCIHCSSLAANNIEHVDLTTIKYRLNKLGVLKEQIAEIVLTGGEPLTRSDLKEIINQAHAISRKVSLFTIGHTGVTVPEESQWRQLKDTGLDSVVYSVHSIDEDVNNSFFRASVLKHTLKSLQNAKAVGMRVEVNSVLTLKNAPSLRSTIHVLTSQYGVEKVRLLRFVGQGRGARKTSELLVDANTAETLIISLKESFGDHIHIEGFPKLHRCRSNEKIGTGCQFGTGFFHIDVDGFVLPCPAVKRNVATLIGNIDQCRDIKKLFRSGAKHAKNVIASMDEFLCFSQASWKRSYDFRSELEPKEVFFSK